MPTQFIFGTVASLQEVYELSRDVQGISCVGSLSERGDKYLKLRKNLIPCAYIAAQDGDVNTQNFLATIRKFIVSNDVGVRVMKYNGIDFSFTPGVPYIVSPGEANFFLTKAKDLGFNFSYDTLANWVASGSQQFFYW